MGTPKLLAVILRSGRSTTSKYRIAPVQLAAQNLRAIALRSAGYPPKECESLLWVMLKISLADIFFQDAVAVGMAQLPQGFSFDLTNPLASDVKDLTNFLQGLHPSVI